MNFPLKDELKFALFLSLVYGTLRLFGYIDWSWWWVLSPIWLGLSLLCLAIFMLGATIVIKEHESIRRK